jgi:predicted kinase
MLTITIMQGESGSGKSTVAGRLAEETGAAIVSADLFPDLYTTVTEPDGTVKVAIRVNLLGDAFGWMFRNAIEHLQAGRSIIVDNTNTTVEEVAPFILLAQAFNAAPRLVRVRSTVERKSVHGVPEAALKGQKDRLAAFAPSFHWQFVKGFTSETIEN